MIHVDETDPLGDVPPAFPYREVEIQRGVDPKQLYELSSELGRGKFGVVYKCKEKSTGVRLAAKFIQIQKKGDRRNIEREVHMMNVLQHSKIAQLYAAFEFDRTFCVMMELVEGGELFDRVLDEKFVLTERACSIFMRQICDAVAYIHGNNIIHLDMKPENILCLTEAGNRIKIIDFGLAREYDPDNKLQVLFGTPEFVAPEVVNFEAISFATDMWSVGVIAYVLVSGLSPFAGEDDIQTMGNITIGRYDFLDEAFDEVSEEAIDFINRCLVKDQKDRLTAEDALKHKWIKRKPQYYPTNRRPSIPNFKQILLETNNNNTNVTNNEIDKENLKELVGKWNDTPNNRYAFEQDTENIIAPSGDAVQLRRPTLPEVSGLANGTNTSGSRRGSIARGNGSVEVERGGNKEDIENEAPNGGDDGTDGVATKVQTVHQTNGYCDQQQKKEPFAVGCTPERTIEEYDRQKLREVNVTENGVSKNLSSNNSDNDDDEDSISNKQANVPTVECNASFGSYHQMFVTRNASVGGCFIDGEGENADENIEGNRNDDADACDNNNSHSSSDNNSSTSSSICSSNSKASISSLSDGLASEPQAVESDACTNNNNFAAPATTNEPKKDRDDGGLVPAACPTVEGATEHCIASPPADTDIEVHVRRHHPRTFLSSGFCLSADGATDGTANPIARATEETREQKKQEDESAVPEPNHLQLHHRNQVRADLRRLSDLLKLSLTNITTVKEPEEVAVPGAMSEEEEQSVPVGGTSRSSTASTVELDSELECLKSKVNTMIRTSRAQNKLNELAQRPDFLANDPFKLPTFRFLPKSISLCNDDSVFKENYTKFCDRNSGDRQLREKAPSEAEQKLKPSGGEGTVARKKPSTVAGSGTLKKKKEPHETTTPAATVSTVTTTTFASTGSGKIASSTTTVRKTIVKQHKVVVDVEDDGPTTTLRKPPLQTPTKSLDSTAASDTTTTTTSTSIKSSTLTPSASIKRTKFRVNQMSSRDVPVAAPPNATVARRFLERSGVLGAMTTTTSTSTSTKHQHHQQQPNGSVTKLLSPDDDTVTANNLRNSALKLRSLSVDWDAQAVDVAVENRSMKTINSFLKRHAVSSNSAVRQIQAQLEATITTTTTTTTTTAAPAAGATTHK